MGQDHSTTCTLKYTLQMQRGKVVETNETGHTNKRRLMSEFKVIANRVMF